MSGRLRQALAWLGVVIGRKPTLADPSAGGPSKPSSARANGLPPAVAYTASVGLEKGLALLMIPIVAAYLTPADYGRYEVAVSLLEFVGLVVIFGLTDTLVRFASTEPAETERLHTAAEVLGAALVLAIAVGAAMQLLTPWLMELLHITLDEAALRWALAATAAMTMIELPLVWMRLRQRSSAFLLCIACRALSQLLLSWWALAHGHGTTGLLEANAFVMLMAATVLLTLQIRETGIAFSTRLFRRIAGYSLPLLGAALALFAMGACSRWFLPGHVSNEAIAHFGLAAKLSMAASILMQPFLLWWVPRRIEMLSRPNGLEDSRDAWSLGFSILLLNAVLLALAGPLFIALFLPAGYAGASTYIPWLVLAQFLHQLSALCSVGSYARSSGLGVLAIDGVGAAIAIAGYTLLVPRIGVAGAIAAMIFAHGLRVCLYLADGRRQAPIPYPAFVATALCLAAAGFVWMEPARSSVLVRALWATAALLTTALLLYQAGFMRLGSAFLSPMIARWRHGV